MRLRDWTIALIITLLTLTGITSITQRFKHIEKQQRELDQKIETLLTNEDIDPLLQEIQELKSEIEILKTQLKKNTEALSNRGSERARIMKVTAYDLSYKSCKKYPEHPEYGITASGKRVQEWHTVAAGPELPFGTKLYIPYFKDYPNKGIFTVEDRGSAITNGCLDIYMASYEDCMEFGVKYLEVYVIDEGGL